MEIPKRKRSRLLFFALICSCTLSSGDGLAQNSISGARQSIEAKDKDRDKKDEDEPWNEEHDRHPRQGDRWADEDDEDASLLGNLVREMLFLPYTAPRWLLNDNGQPASFTDYPFATEGAANLVINQFPSTTAKIARLRFGMEYGDNFDRQQKITTRVLLDSKFRLGIDTSFDYLREQLGASEHDQTWLGDINLTWRFAQSSRAEWRAGIGYNWQSDSFGSDGGFNFTYGGNIYMNQPNVIDFDLDLGQIGNASLNRFRVGYSLYLKRVRLTLGYEHLRIGTFKTNYFNSGIGIDF